MSTQVPGGLPTEPPSGYFELSHEPSEKEEKIRQVGTGTLARMQPSTLPSLRGHEVHLIKEYTTELQRLNFPTDVSQQIASLEPKVLHSFLNSVKSIHSMRDDPDAQVGGWGQWAQRLYGIDPSLTDATVSRIKECAPAKELLYEGFKVSFNQDCMTVVDAGTDQKAQQICQGLQNLGIVPKAFNPKNAKAITQQQSQNSQSKGKQVANQCIAQLLIAVQGTRQEKGKEQAPQSRAPESAAYTESSTKTRKPIQQEAHEATEVYSAVQGKSTVKKKEKLITKQQKAHWQEEQLLKKQQKKIEKGQEILREGIKKDEKP